MALPLTIQAPAVSQIRPTRGWALLISAALVITGMVLLTDPFAPAPDPAGLPDELADEPDLYIEDAFITQYQPSGEMKYQLASIEIRHFDRDNLTRLAQPRLTLYNETQPPWYLESDHGYIRGRADNHGGVEELVYLRKDVGLEQRHADGRRVRIESPSLYIFPDRQYAETEQNVMIDTDVGRTTAVGLRGDLQRGLLKLSPSAQQRVHTIILPGQFK